MTITSDSLPKLPRAIKLVPPLRRFAAQPSGARNAAPQGTFAG